MTKILRMAVATFSCLSLFCIKAHSQDVEVGASRTELYFPLLEGKNIGVVGNQTSVFAGVHLVDTLLAAGYRVEKVFSPEHGFRGQAEAGKKVDNQADEKTGLPVISLYGNHKTPPPPT